MRNKIGIDLETEGVISIGSNTGIGLTTLLCFMAVEDCVNGKNVIILTQHYDKVSIQKKIANLLKIDEANASLYIIDQHDGLFNILNKKKVDIVYVDTMLKTTDIEVLREIAMTYDVPVITGIQLRKHSPTGLDIETYPMKVLQLVNQAHILSVKKEFTLLQRLKYFFGFWLKKPNRSLKIIKNRYGSDGITKDIFIDFKKINDGE
jgi:hypothetical protein